MYPAAFLTGCENSMILLLKPAVPNIYLVLAEILFDHPQNQKSYTMKTKVLLMFLLCVFVTSFAQKNALVELDSYMEKRQVFESEKKEKIRNLEKQLGLTKPTLQEKYRFCSELYKQYSSYKYDSAYVYAKRMLDFAQQLKNADLVSESKIALSFSCVSAGLFKEATEMSNSIDTTQLSKHYKARLYSFLSVLYINMADFTGTEPYSSHYRELSIRFCDRCIALSDKDDPEAIMATMRKYQLRYQLPEAIRLAEKYFVLHPGDLHNDAIVASMLGYFYQATNNLPKAMECFAKAAIADIKTGTKETSAVRQLAELLYAKGDIQRAYSYAIMALEDANFYNARQRKIEVGRILPIVEAGRFEIIRQQKNKLLIYAWLISILFVLFVAATFVIMRQKRRLNDARLLILKQNQELIKSNEELTLVQQRISRQNIELLDINKKLQETNHIKDEYIGYFFSTNSSYLEKIDELRRLVARKIRAKQYQDLLETLAASDIRKEREDLFVLFDRIFIKMFPDFIDRYNELFSENDRIQIKPDGSLTPELRIFALIRLGITESERIAQFLDFSLSTVKNYKTKAKNRSLVANEQFEPKIMEIESIKNDFQV